MIPVTTLPEGWDPPRMSCMKNDKGGCSRSACGMVALVAAVELTPVGVVETGVATGATTSPSGGTTVSGTSATGDNVALGVGTGMEGPGMGDTIGAGIWPLGNVVGGPTTGATSGSSVSIGSDAAGSLGVSGDCGSVSSRIRAEVAHPRVMASKKRQIVVLSVLEV